MYLSSALSKPWLTVTKNLSYIFWRSFWLAAREGYSGTIFKESEWNCCKLRSDTDFMESQVLNHVSVMASLSVSWSYDLRCNCNDDVKWRYKILITCKESSAVVMGNWSDSIEMEHFLYSSRNAYTVSVWNNRVLFNLVSLNSPGSVSIFRLRLMSITCCQVELVAVTNWATSS